jgi:hypothetical protein
MSEKWQTGQLTDSELARERTGLRAAIVGAAPGADQTVLETRLAAVVAEQEDRLKMRTFVPYTAETAQEGMRASYALKDADQLRRERALLLKEKAAAQEGVEQRLICDHLALCEAALADRQQTAPKQ